MTQPTDASRTGTRTLVLLILGLVVALAAVALLTSGGGDDDPGASTDPVIGGAALPTYPGDPDGDPAIGMLAPSTLGLDFAGETVELTDSSQPTAIVFLAHWCQHCQREVPQVQAMVDDGTWPGDLRLVSVTTSIDPARDNYPPREWLEREGWTAPVLVDPDQTVSAAWGLTAFPYWVFLNADDTVALRVTGNLPPQAIEAIAERLEKDGQRPSS